MKFPMRLVFRVALLIGSLTLAAAASAQVEERIYDMNEVKREGQGPIARVQAAPQFPFEMSREGISGEVIVEFIIDKTGKVRTSRVVRASNPAFGPNALLAVNKWMFKPGLIDGKRVEVRANQLLEFNLEGRMAPGTTARRKEEEPGSITLPPPSPESLAAELLNLTKDPVDKKPKALSQDAPWYPTQMARAGLIGEVTVEFVIDTDGYVRNPVVVESNNPWFERPAIDAMLTWRFSPGEKNGRKVNVRAQQKLRFNIPGGRSVDVWRVTKGKDHDKQPPESRWEKPPVPRLTLFPVYPKELLEKKTKGKVRVSYVIGPKGAVVMSKIIEATTPEMGQAVLATMDAWRFRPATDVNGKPVYVPLGTEYEFLPSGQGDVPVSIGTEQVLKALKKSPESIVAANQLDKALAATSRRAPVYPTACLREGKAGEALIEFFIDKNGDAQLPSIVSSTTPEFGYAAAQAVATWRFEPPLQNGKRVIVKARIPVNFTTPEKLPADAVMPARLEPAIPGSPPRLFEVALTDKAPVRKPGAGDDLVEAARKTYAGTSAVVEILYIVSTDGEVKQSKVKQSSIPKESAVKLQEVERALVAAVRGWAFTPGERAGEAVNVQMTEVFDFRPEKKK
ncbi:TonB family protein [Oleiharenicola lentus]|uniref:TonB family protein n=1 Tax=Oleiharenicola lentus TaxID=2508720 RepID=UPI003F67DAA0